MVIVALYRILDLSNIVNEGQRIFAPRWPIFWADYLHYLTVIDIVHVFFILATLTGAFFYRHRAGRREGDGVFRVARVLRRAFDGSR